MKYGTTIIVLALFNLVVLFSGLPMGWKKGLIIADLALLVFIGWILREIYLRKARRLAERAKAVEASLEHDIDRVANQVTRNVEREIDQIQGQ